MKALTLRAPWGTAIARLGKDIENRSWKPPAGIIGQRIAIHEGAGLDREGLEELHEEYGEFDIDHGLIVCTAVVRGWIANDGSYSETLSSREAARASRSPWYMQEIGWVLDDIRRPRSRVRIKGMLGVWNLPTRASKRLAG